MGLSAVVSAIKDKKNECFAVASHRNLEGDAIGSMLAMSELLKAAGKKTVLLSPEDMPEIYKFLPNASLVKARKYPRRIAYDAACLLDCTDLDRLGDAKAGIDLSRPILNIDHHISNKYFGTVNWIEPGMSCSGEQVYRLFEKMGIPINKNAALYIYIAILTDTGSFRYSNTTANTHKAVSELLSHGICPVDIYRRIYEGIGPGYLRMLASVLASLDTDQAAGMAWVEITQDMLKRYHCSIDDTQDFVNYPRSMKGIKIAIAFKEAGAGVVKVSFRSNDGLDVNKLAGFFGGGGHAAASGCVIKGTLGTVKKIVLDKCKKSLTG